MTLKAARQRLLGQRAIAAAFVLTTNIVLGTRLFVCPALHRPPRGRRVQWMGAMRTRLGARSRSHVLPAALFLHILLIIIYYVLFGPKVS